MKPNVMSDIKNSRRWTHSVKQKIFTVQHSVLDELQSGVNKFARKAS